MHSRCYNISLYRLSPISPQKRPPAHKKDPPPTLSVSTLHTYCNLTTPLGSNAQWFEFRVERVGHWKGRAFTINSGNFKNIFFGFVFGSLLYLNIMIILILFYFSIIFLSVFSLLSYRILNKSGKWEVGGGRDFSFGLVHKSVERKDPYLL